MPHIKIRLTSPSRPQGEQNGVHEILQIKTPDGFLSFTETGELISTAPRETNPAVEAPSATCTGEDTDKPLGDEKQEETPSYAGTDAARFYSNVITEVKEEELYEIRRNSPEPTSAAGANEEHRDLNNTEFFLPRRELTSFKVELDAFKAKLEEEVIERFKLEDELKSERGIHEFETRILQEQIEELGKCVLQKNLKIETLESALEEYQEQGEGIRLELEGLQNFVARRKTEATRLRSEVISANDQTEAMMGEVELLRKQAKEDATEKNSIKKRLHDEIEDYSKEIQELRDSLEEKSKINGEKEKKVEALGKEVTSYREQVKELEEELRKASCKLSADQESYKSLQVSSNTEELLAMSNELNEVYREHLETQSKVLLLTETLNRAQREIEDVRHAEEKHSFELQNYKERYTETKDLSTALKEENRHLKNTFQKRSRDSRETRKKYLILETEVTWLREALNIVGISKPGDTFKEGVNSDQIDS